MKSINWPLNLRLRRIHVLILSILVIQAIPLVVTQAGNEAIATHPRSYTYVGPFARLIHVEELNRLFIVSHDHRGGDYGLFKMNYQGTAIKQEWDYDLEGEIMDYCYDGEDRIYLVTDHQLLVYNIRSSIFERIYTNSDSSLLGSYGITRCYADGEKVYLGTQDYNLIVLTLSNDIFDNHILSQGLTSYWEVKVIEGSETHVIVGTAEGLIVIEKSSMDFHYYRFGSGYNDNNINTVSINGTTAYIGTQNNLYSMNIPTGSYYQVDIDFQNINVYYKDILSTLVDNTGLLIVCTDSIIYSYDGVNTEYEYCYNVQSIVHISSEDKYYALIYGASDYLCVIDPIDEFRDSNNDINWIEIIYVQFLTTSSYQPPPEYIDTGFIPLVFLALGAASLGYILVKMKRH